MTEKTGVDTSTEALDSMPNLLPEPIATVPRDPLREAAALRIKIRDLPDGGKEFILPALRNLRVKLTASFFWLVMTAGLVFGWSVFTDVVGIFPTWIRWLLIDHGLFALGFVGLIVLLLSYVCLDMWLRSSRIVAKAGELQVVTHWLVFKRAINIPASKILKEQKKYMK
jgi:hypothetical protein